MNLAKPWCKDHMQILLLALLLLLQVSVAGAQVDNGAWSETFGMNTGLSGTALSVRDIVEYDGGHVICGSFEMINGVAANNIALMSEPESNIFTYTPLGEGVDYWAQTAVEFGGDLIVIGNLTTAGGVEVENMARWDGSDWQAMPGNEAGYFKTLSVVDGVLLAAGQFGSENNFIMMWTGTSWTQYGPDAPFSSGQVFDMILYQGDLVACGEFNNSSSPAMKNIVVLHDGVWQPLGDGIESIALLKINALSIFEGDLIAGGTFPYGSDYDHGNVARWDGSTWYEMGNGIGEFLEEVKTLYATTGVLYAGGSFYDNTPFGSYFNLAMWDSYENIWRSPAGTLGDVDHDVNCLTGVGNEIYIGGEFTQIDGRDMNNLAHYYGGYDWGNMTTLGLYGLGVSYSVRDMIVYDGDLVAANAWQAGDLATRGIAHWNGSEWAGYGGGLDPETEWGTITVNAVTEYDGMLIAGGNFNAPVGDDHNLAAWNGSEWTSLGAEIYFLHSVTALAGYGGDLIVGGQFNQASGATGDHIMRYDGVSWHAMGCGLYSPYTVNVDDLCEYQGELYIAGIFDEAGGVPVNNIARWDGSDLHPVGAGVGWVRDMVVFEDQLLAGGNLGITAWDGENWTTPFPPVSDLTVQALAVQDGCLYAACYYWGEAEFKVWDGDQWLLLAAGASSYSSLQSYNGDLFMGGDFREIEGINSYGIACWLPTSTAVTGMAAPGLRLAPNFPNPFNPSTTITYSLAADGVACLSIHDVSGRLLRTLVDRPVAAGEHNVVWDGCGDDGRIAPSGVYLSRLIAEGETRTGKLILSK